MAHRSENFFLHAARGLFQISIDRRLHVKAVVQSIVERGHSSSGHDRCAFLAREMIVGKNFFTMLDRDQGPTSVDFSSGDPMRRLSALRLSAATNRSAI